MKLTIASGIGLLLTLIWLSRPPRDHDRRALLAGVLLTAGWLVAAGIAYGVPFDAASRRFQWLVLLAVAGAPLVVLLVWSGVALVAYPRKEDEAA